MNINDIELLRRYVLERSEAAFADLVRQHIALVYSAALRQTNGDAPLAEDATQLVFTDLARKAARLTRHTSLAGWLYTSTRDAAAGLRRAEQRRSAREQEAHAMNELLQPAGPDPAWEHLRPVLDEAMHDLKAEDREAVLLRYFEHLPLAAVGTRLGVTENTARMRVDRALDKLRGALAKLGVTSTAGALAAVLTAQAASAVPAGLAASISATAIASAGTASALAVLLARVLVSTKLKLLTGAAVLVAIVIPVVWHLEESHRNVAAVSAAVQPAAATPATQADAASDLNNPTTQPNSIAITNASILRLTILAADAKKPLAAVEVECTVTKDKQQTQEKFISRRDGICDFYYDRDTDALELVSQTDGFADTILHWEPAKGDTIPTNYTLRLVRAVHIGGHVKDENGLPVAGANVTIARNIAREDPAVVLAHENREFQNIEILADAEGRWSLDRIAPDMLGRTIGFVRHPDYLDAFVPLESNETQQQLREGTFVFKLSPAPTVSGTIVDPQDSPVSGARVVVGELGKGSFVNATTGPNGSFVAKRSQSGATRISFIAKGFVPKVMKLDENADSNALKVVLETGRGFRLKVMDAAGQPVSKAHVVAALPGTIPAVLASTDAGGKATVQTAPAEPIELRIEAAGFEPAPVAVPGAEAEELNLVLVKEAKVVVSGAVTDAAAGRPVPAFRVICGTMLVTGPFPIDRTFSPSPRTEDWFKFGGGKFRLEPSHFLDTSGDAKTRGFALKFEAEGYAPVLSRVIQADEGEVRLDVVLVPAKTVQVTVLNPDGRPATDAEVGLAGPGLNIQITRERHLTFMLGTGLLRPDNAGIFALPPEDSIKQVMAINAQGFVAASPATLARQPILQLQPFGRVEGQWLVGNEPAAGRVLGLGMAWVASGGYILDCSTTTDSEGRFAIPQVPAGKYQVVWNAPLGAGWSGLEGKSLTTSKPVADVEVRPGETSTVIFGGYIVSVRLRWPADFAPGKNTRVGAFIGTPGPELPPAISQDAQAFAQWISSPEVRAMVNAVRHYEFTERADGVWTAEDVPAGATYSLEATAVDRAGTNGSQPLAWGRMSVTIPANPSTGQFDAGELKLQGVKSVAAPAGASAR